MFPTVEPLGAVHVVHGVPVHPVQIRQLAGGCQLLIIDQVPDQLHGRLDLIRGTLLYAFTGVGLRGQLTAYAGISELIDGSRVINSFRQRADQLRPAGLALLTGPTSYPLPVLRHLESAVLKRVTMRVRALNRQTSAPEATRQLDGAGRLLADELAQQVADAISTYALGGYVNLGAYRYRNARDHAAALIHRLRGRAVDTRQVVDMLSRAGADLTSRAPVFTARRDLVQREQESGNARIGHLRHDGVVIYYPQPVLTAAQALTDYLHQRQQGQRLAALPLPTPASDTWCPCPYCSPVTTFTTTSAETSHSPRRDFDATADAAHPALRPSA